MKVILTQDVKTLGKTDEIVNVNEGYARNFLFPRNLAVSADGVNMDQLLKRRKTEAQKEDKNLEHAKALAAKLNDAKITIKGKVGAGSKLYGSITNADITDAIEKQTHTKIDKRKIEIDEHIKSLGEFDVPIRLHKNVIAHVKVEIIGE